MSDSKTNRAATALTITFWTVSYIASILIPSLISASIAVDKTSSFCDKHTDICDQYRSIEYNSSLIYAVKKEAYVDASMGSLVSVIAVASAILVTVAIPWRIYHSCLSSKKEKTGEKKALLISNPPSNSCYSLFKKLKENVLPTKFSVYHFFMTTITLIGGCTFATWAAASGVKLAIICTNPTSTNQCVSFFPNTTAPQLNEVSHLSENVYDSMMSSGIILGTISSLSIAIGTMALIACVKYRVHQKEKRLFRQILHDEGNHFTV